VKQALLIIICLIMMATSASAAALDSVTFDVANNIITVSGNVGESINGRVMTLCVLNSGDSIDTVQNNIEYMNILNIDTTGEYVHKFGFSGNTGSYVFMTIDGNTIKEKKTMDYFSKETLDEFAQNIGEGKLTRAETEAGIKLYCDSFGVDMQYFGKSRNFDLLIDTIMNSKKTILEGKSVALSTVVAAVKYECELLDKIEECKIWYEVEDYLKENEALVDIDFNAYDKCDKKSKVCSAFIGVQTRSLDALSEKFNELVEKYSEKKSSGGGGSGSSGSSKHGITYNKPVTNTVVTFVPSVPEVVFSDIESVPWAKSEILALGEMGILSGVGNGIFNPDGPVTREQAAKIISVAFGFDGNNAGIKFEDADVNAWYYPYISSLYENGIISGISDTHFGVGQGITRQDLAVILYRTMLNKGYNVNTVKNNFKDFESISDYAKDAVSYVAGAGIISGTESGYFNPHEGATRAQIAKLVYNMLNFQE